MLKQMWKKLDAFTYYSGTSKERDINVRNEWGGFSRRLAMPVFTGWQDLCSKADGKLRVLVSDRNWSAAGTENQEFWIAQAMKAGGDAAFFVIRAVDPNARPRKVEWLDDSRVLAGSLSREGDVTYITSSRIIAL
jgi:hypothetical protein